MLKTCGKNSDLFSEFRLHLWMYLVTPGLCQFHIHYFSY